MNGRGNLKEVSGFIHVNDLDYVSNVCEIYLYPRKLLLRRYKLKFWKKFQEERVWKESNEFVAKNFVDFSKFIQIRVLLDTNTKEIRIRKPHRS